MFIVMDLKTISKKIANFKQKLVKNSEISIKNDKLLRLFAVLLKRTIIVLFYG